MDELFFSSVKISKGVFEFDEKQMVNIFQITEHIRPYLYLQKVPYSTLASLMSLLFNDPIQPLNFHVTGLCQTFTGTHV